jgi:glycosyltransferase involved in cell wall biosynthesis
MDKWPVVTAIVNTYERPTKLRSALSSVLAQDFSDFEVIVIHDGPSSARTKHVCEEFAEKFTARSIPFQHVATSENSGYQCTPKNVATWMARGDYIAYLDDDNEWTPDHLSVLLHAIEEEHKWPDFTYGRREYRFANGYTSDKLRTGPSPFVPFEKEALERMSASPMANFIDTSDVLIAKGAIWRMHLATGKMWNEELRRFGDWEFFSRGIFFSGWRGKAVDKVVQYYYWHGENIQLTRPAKEVPTGTPA